MIDHWKDFNIKCEFSLRNQFENLKKKSNPEGIYRNGILSYWEDLMSNGY